MTDADQLREQAHDILRDQRFHERRTPAPFRGVLRWIGDRLEPVLGPVSEWFVDAWADETTRVIFVAAVVLVVAALTQLVIRRRTARAVRDGSARVRRRGADPAALEREAAQAEAAGLFDLAVRLRFRAGVLRLQISGRVPRGASTATRGIGRLLDSRDFDVLGDRFDAVAYGGVPATQQDAREAKDRWQRVLVESSS